MNIEIHTPELEKRVRMHIQSGRFHDTEELLTKAFDALEGSESLRAPDERTGADLIAALQASPYRELEIEPARVPLTIVRDVTL
jgi:hypothetical protein